MNLTLAEIAAAIGVESNGNNSGRNIAVVSTDTRTLQAGDLFVALRGENFDGHRFCAEAVRLGAGGLVVSDAETARAYTTQLPVFFVPDTLDALGAIAHCWRMKFTPRSVALSGSCGKTTTKDLIAHVASRHFSLLHTKGNLNNRIGVPQMLFELDSRHTHVLLETGMNQPGELAALARIIEADGVALTNVNQAHCGNFAAPDGVREAKAELIRYSARAQWAVLNADCADSRIIRQRDVKDSLQVITFGECADADVRIENVRPLEPYGAQFDLLDRRGGTEGEKAKCEIHLFGRGHVHNAACAAAVLLQWGLDLPGIADELRDFRPGELRSQVLRCGELTVIADCYNSNPAALQSALATLGAMPAAGRRVAIIGDMRELGAESEKLHRACGKLANQCEIDLLLTVGKDSRWLGAEFHGEKIHFAQKTDLIARLEELLRSGDTILIKGSRGLALEEILEHIKKSAGNRIDIEGIRR